jgi:PIN domain nuclease of toxin-antitoxin system
MIIDTSALLAFFQAEPGRERVEAVMTRSALLLSSINRVEVKGKLMGSGRFTPQAVDAKLSLLDQILDIVPFDLEQSDLAAYYYARRNPYNLSLGDCACLALAEARGETVLTAEKSWAKLPNLPFKVHLIR